MALPPAEEGVPVLAVVLPSSPAHSGIVAGALSVVEAMAFSLQKSHVQALADKDGALLHRSDSNHSTEKTLVIGFSVMLATGSVHLPLSLGRGLCCQLNNVSKVLVDDPTVVDDQAPHPPLPLQDINTPGVTEGFVDPSSPHVVTCVYLAGTILECLAFNVLGDVLEGPF